MKSTVEPDWEALGKRWWSHVQFLADDALEGRDTGSPGYEKAADYMSEQFRAAGLAPGGVGGYRQPMDLDVVRIDESRCNLQLVQDGRAEPLELGEDALMGVRSQADQDVDARATFAGYALTIPESNHDDLADPEVKGKIVVFMGGGPSEISGPVSAHYQSLEQRRRAFQKAGAIGGILIENPKGAEVPWSLMASFRFQPNMVLRDPGDEVAPPLRLEVLFNTERAGKLFAGSGHSFEEVLSAVHADRPLPHFPLAVSIRARVGTTRSQVKSENVIGVLQGSDPDLQHEYVIISAHLDHIGIGEPINGDRINSGAMDDASGDASLIEIARSLRESGTRPKRSILFLSVTGEEKGLLGSQYFAAHPTVPGRLVADLNMDMFLPLFPFKYLEVQGLAESSLGDDVRAVAETAGVTVQADKQPEHNRFIRSDQYSFIKKGVPALSFKFGFIPGSLEGELFKAWYAHRYHTPSDDLEQPVDLVAAAQFNAVLEKLALRIANADRRPEWKGASFFRRFAT
ncbi:MAG: M28 family metallopeptidase [Thermoplasmata archaeon]